MYKGLFFTRLLTFSVTSLVSQYKYLWHTHSRGSKMYRITRMRSRGSCGIPLDTRCYLKRSNSWRNEYTSGLVTKSLDTALDYILPFYYCTLSHHKLPGCKSSRNPVTTSDTDWILFML
jgi:hypothetical protein